MTSLRDKGSLSKKWLAIGLALAAPLLFVWLAALRLDAQGLYYDEVHQAPAAFAYVGRAVPFFVSATVPDAAASFPLTRPLKDLPLLNMHYSGAIKSAVYGLYLRIVTPEFTVVSWRLTGIAMAALGLGMFVLLAHRTVSTGGLALVVVLLLTDITVILATRHDWGPVALALAIRLFWIGVWLRGAASPQPSHLNSFILGFLVGVAAFEKLSSLVLLLPLAMLMVSRERRTFRHLLAVTGALAVGGLPLVVANATSWFTRGLAISLEATGGIPVRQWHDIVRYISQYLSLGAGELVRGFILGSPTLSYVAALEPWLMGLTMMLVAWSAWPRRSSCAGARRALQALAAYIAVGVGVYLLPRATWIHHWILGTPFQYVAIALALDSARASARDGRGRRGVALCGLLLAVGAVLVTRTGGWTSLELALSRGEAGPIWHADLTRLGRIAARRAGEAAFIAADWGVAPQIFCLAQGRPDLVKELYWWYRGPEDLLRFQKEAGVGVFYAVTLRPRSGVAPENTMRIFRDLESSPNWQEAEAEPELRDLAAVTVRKFLFVPARP